jgi:hypothetical protein
MESQIEQRRTMVRFRMATAGLILVLLFGWTATATRFGGGRASESADTGEVAAMHTNSRAVLVIPNQDCQAASFVLATVTRHIRDAEREVRSTAQQLKTSTTTGYRR